MGKLTREELQQIIERDLPGHRVVASQNEPVEEAISSDASSTDLGVEAATPDLATLRRKYLRKKYLSEDTLDAEEAADASVEAERLADEDSDDDDEIVLVASKNSSDPLDRRSQVKAVIVDTRTKKIIGAQG